MMSFLRSYFLRIYAIERHKGEPDERACLREALFQTRFLVMIATAGLGSAGVVIAGRLSRTAWAALTEYRPLIMAAFVIFTFVLAFTVVRRALVQIEDIPARTAGVLRGTATGTTQNRWSSRRQEGSGR